MAFQVAGIAAAFAVALGWLSRILIAKLIFTLGISALTYVGVSELIDEINAYIALTYTGIPLTVLQILNILNVPQAINILVSAFTFRVTLIPLGKKIIFNPPTTPTP